MLKTLPAEFGISFEMLRKTGNFISYSIVFGKLSMLKILMKHGHQIIMDTSHNVNRLH